MLRTDMRLALKRARRDRYRVFLDLYAGSAGISHFIERTSHGCIVFEISLGNQYDLTRTCVHKLILGWITSGVVCGVFLATQCSSWSLARHGPPNSNWCTLRSKEYILGIPNLLPPHQNRSR